MKRLFAIMLAGALLLSSCAVKKPDAQGTPGAAVDKPGESSAESTAAPDSGEEQQAPAELKFPPVVQTRTLRAVRVAEDGETELAEVSRDSMTLSGEGYERAAEAVERLLSANSEQVEQEADELAEMAQEQYAFCLEDGYFFSSYSVSEDYEITRLDTRVLSVKSTDYDYSGGAHGMYGYGGTTIDLESGVELELPHLMNDHAGFLEKAKEVICDELADREEELYEDYRAYVSQGLEKATWYLDASGIVVVFNPYEIAPYASGVIEARVPYSEAAPFMKEEYCRLKGGAVAKVRSDDVAALEFREGAGEGSVSWGYRQVGEYLDELVITVNGDEKWVRENAYAQNFFFLRRPEGRSFLVFSVDWASEDYETYVYELTDEKFEQVDSCEGCIIARNVNLESLKLWLYKSVLGTRTTEIEYAMSQDGKLTQISDRYEFYNQNQWNGLKTVQELPVFVNGGETTLPAGTELRIVATDDAGIAWFETEDGTVQGEIHYTQGEYALMINDRSEYDYFESLPYSG